MSENQDSATLEDSEGKKIVIHGSHEDLVKLKQYFQTLESSQKTLLEEKESLEGTLSLLAEKEFNRRKLALQNEGYDVSKIETIEDLKSAEMVSKKYQKEAYTGAPLSKAQLGLTEEPENLSEKGYDDVESLILDLERESKSEDVGKAIASKAILKELAKKSMKKPIHYELQSNMRTIARKPKQSGSESLEAYQKRLETWKKSQKWKVVENE